MELTARVFFALFVIFFRFNNFDRKKVYVETIDYTSRFIIHGSPTRFVCLSGKARIKSESSKSARKRMCQRRAYCVGLTGIGPFFILLLSGDVELNPGPTNNLRSTKAAAKDESPDFSEILLRLEKKIEEGQESIVENQNKMLARLSIIEKEIETFKEDIDNLKVKQSALEDKVISMSENIGTISDHGRDLQFLMDRQEQYSRKNSVRIKGVLERSGEDIEMVTIDTLKKELGLDFEKSDIDIVHRVGRGHTDIPRSILVKFLSHKSKEKVMRAKKKAKNVKIQEDLAPGIKRIFDEVSSKRRFLNIESVWSIDGRIKFRYVNDSRTLEIRSYADCYDLVHVRQ